MAVRSRNATRRRSSSVEMTAPLATCIREEQRSVIRFLSSEGMKPFEIHRRMKVEYGAACLSLQQVYGWTGKVMDGISSVTDSTGPGQAHPVVTPVQYGDACLSLQQVYKCTRQFMNSISSVTDSPGPGQAHPVVTPVQYGDACLSLQQVYKCTRQFMNSISSVTDSPGPGQAHPVVTPEGIAAVESHREGKSPRNSE